MSKKWPDGGRKASETQRTQQQSEARETRPHATPEGTMKRLSIHFPGLRNTGEA